MEEEERERRKRRRRGSGGGEGGEREMYKSALLDQEAPVVLSELLRLFLELTQ